MKTADAAYLANAAGGLQIESFGVTSITKSQLLNEVKAMATRRGGRVVGLAEAAEFADTCRADGRRIVFTNGCFDLLHSGHIHCLEEAAALGDVLIVGVNDYESVRRNKGADRPVVSAADRAAHLAALSVVNRVIIFSDDTRIRLIEALKPDVLVKGGTTEVIVGREYVEQYGARVVCGTVVENVSTTQMLDKMRRG